MKKYNTFIVFLVLVLMWSFFFGAFKFYTWAFFQKSFSFRLEEIAWSLSLWWVLAYLFWGIFSTIYEKRKILVWVAFFVMILLLWLYFWGFGYKLLWLGFIASIGVMYSFWSIAKNSLIFVEVQKTWKSDTFVNWLAGIIFIISLLVWSVLWPSMFERFWIYWSLTVIIPMFIAFALSFMMKYSWKEDTLVHEDENLKWFNLFSDLFKKYINNIKALSRTYWMILLCVWILWSISTIIAQQAIEYSMEKFGKTESEAAFIFLYSGVGAIIWNAISMFIKNNRWLFYRIFVYLFALFILAFPFVANSYLITIVLSLVIAIVFWAASNLLDAYYFFEIWRIWKKEHWSWVYGLVMSVIIASMMFSVTAIQPLIWRVNLFILLASLIAVSWLLVRLNLHKLHVKW